MVPAGYPMTRHSIAIVGGGPAGLAAAEVLARADHVVTIYEAMPTVGRKFLLAGKSGLNITHSENLSAFLQRFPSGGERLRGAIERFAPDDIRAWADGLGTETFVGTSGRVFPKAMKASPLLRAWLRRLEAQGVTIRTKHRWVGLDHGQVLFQTPEGPVSARPDAVLLACGGASWPRLGSDAAWVPILEEKAIGISSFRPANCGFDVAWSDVFRERFAGTPVKSVAAASPAGSAQGEFVVTRHGIEGSLVYAHASALRDRLEAGETSALTLDLMPGRDVERLERDLRRQNPKASFSTLLKKGAGLDGVKAALLREFSADIDRRDARAIAERIKALDIPLAAPRPIAEAISSAGGVRWDAIDDAYMLKALPGVFVAGEMIDWEAPTGGYLLTACLASGRAAAEGMVEWLSTQR